MEDEFIYIMHKSVRPHFNSVLDLQINNSKAFFTKGNKMCEKK